MDVSFYRGKRVFVTGHTGFKGSWLCAVLVQAGAEVTGYALEPPGTDALYNILKTEKQVSSITGDIRDFRRLGHAFRAASPEIVFHLAAQPLVRESYRHPRDTYETNVMGTVNICECIRMSDTAKSFVNVTTDKVYRNREWEWGYREDDILGGHDPYSGSKSCSELVTDSYLRSYFSQGGPSVSTARAGNVIGGGDSAENRILPDCIRAASQGQVIGIRSPGAVRPYQHVLEALAAYLLIARKQYGNRQYAGSYNIGPDSSSCITAGELADLFCREWGDRASWSPVCREGPQESQLLKLDCSRIKRKLGWHPVWDVRRAVRETVSWTKAYLAGDDMGRFTERQIQEYWKEYGKTDSGGTCADADGRN